MGFVDTLASRIAESIQKNNPNSSSIAVLKYALIALLNLTIIMSSVLIIAAITGRVVDAVVAVLAFPLLRYFSGGLHLRSSTICNIISAILVLVSIYMPINYWYNGLILNLLTILILALYAPSEIRKSKMPKEQFPILKFIAIFVVSTNLFFHSPVLSIVFFAQSVTTIPFFVNILGRTKW
jgi:accessory gene regulator B